jgi:hypothetical protein
MAKAPIPIKERLLAGIRVCEHSGCWLWQRSVQRNGYGQIGSGGKYGGMRNTHRVSWEVHRGEIPAGMQVLHRCDVKICVNPDHLFLGTQAENLRDMDAKGRRRQVNKRGEAHYATRLTADDVRAIRADTRTQAVIGAAYGIGQTAVSAIKRRVKWKSVA